MTTTTKLATALILFSTVLGAVVSQAADSDQATTKGRVTFQAGGTDPEGEIEVNPPTNPEEPGEVIDPEDKPGGETGAGGPLSLDFAPNLDFDIQDISTKDMTYYASLQNAKVVPEGETVPEEGAEAKEVPNFVQITDKRGSGEGWNLSVTQKGQLKTKDGKVLTGAQISFENSEIVTTVEDDSQMPTISYKGTALLGDEELEAATPLMTAGNKQGMGQYQIKFGTLLDEVETASKSVKLFVPGKTVKFASEYVTDLEWNLASGPINGEA